MPMNKYGDMELNKKSGGGKEDLGEMKPSYDRLLDEEDREMERFKVRKEAYLKKLQKMYRIDRDTADQLMDKFGGLAEVIKRFQMVDEEDMKPNYDEGLGLLEKLRGQGQGMRATSKAADEAQ